MCHYCSEAIVFRTGPLSCRFLPLAFGTGLGLPLLPLLQHTEHCWITDFHGDVLALLGAERGFEQLFDPYQGYFPEMAIS